MTNEELRKLLEAFPGAKRVAVEGGYAVLITLVSTEFEGVNEAERQAKVWTYLHTGRADDELPKIEFVFTLTPGEYGAEPQAAQ
jgi:acid stress-induced BolA-like protein IbaG/YrbA